MGHETTNQALRKGTSCIILWQEAETKEAVSMGESSWNTRKRKALAKPFAEQVQRKDSVRGADVSLPSESLLGGDIPTSGSSTDAAVMVNASESGEISTPVSGGPTQVVQMDWALSRVHYLPKQGRSKGGNGKKHAFHVIPRGVSILPLLLTEESVASTHYNADDASAFSLNPMNPPDVGESNGKESVSDANAVWAGGRSRQRRLQKSLQQSQQYQNQRNDSHGNSHQRGGWEAMCVPTTVKGSDKLKDHLSSVPLHHAEMSHNGEVSIGGQSSARASSGASILLWPSSSENSTMDSVPRRVCRMPSPPRSDILFGRANANMRLDWRNVLAGGAQSDTGRQRSVGSFSGRHTRLHQMLYTMMEPPAPVTWVQYRQCRRLSGYTEALRVSQEAGLQCISQKYLGSHSDV